MPVGRSSQQRIRQKVGRSRAPRKTGAAKARSKPIFDTDQIVRLAARLVKPAAIVGGLALLFIGYRALASSDIFTLQRIEIDNASPALQRQIKQTVEGVVGDIKVMSIDLSQVKREVEKLKMVRSATVARSLPNALYLNIEERQPVIPVRRDAQPIVWADDDGMILGEMADLPGRKDALRDGKTPPLARGFYEDPRTAAMEQEDRERVSLYKRLSRELGADGANVWEQIQELDLTYLKSINVRLLQPPVTIVLGNTDYRNRLETALQVLRAINEGDVDALRNLNVQNPQSLIENAANIHVIHAERSDHIVLTFSSPAKRQTRDSESARQDAPTRTTNAQPSAVSSERKPVSAPNTKTQRQEAKPKPPPGKDRRVRPKPNSR